jgi:hypothetical protein
MNPMGGGGCLGFFVLLFSLNIIIQPDDKVYVTIQPDNKRRISSSNHLINLMLSSSQMLKSNVIIKSDDNTSYQGESYQTDNKSQYNHTAI